MTFSFYKKPKLAYSSQNHRRWLHAFDILWMCFNNMKWNCIKKMKWNCMQFGGEGGNLLPTNMAFFIYIFHFIIPHILIFQVSPSLIYLTIFFALRWIRMTPTILIVLEICIRVWEILQIQTLKISLIQTCIHHNHQFTPTSHGSSLEIICGHKLRK